MKMILVLSGFVGALALSLLISPTAQAMETLKVASGSCRLETSGEVIQLTNVDPSQHFGLFAKGSSKEGDQIELDQNQRGAVEIMIQTTTGASLSIIELSTSGLTSIRISVTTKRPSETVSEWLSCDLKVSQN